MFCKHSGELLERLHFQDQSKLIVSATCSAEQAAGSQLALVATVPPALAASEVLDFEPGPPSGGEGYASCEEFADHDFLKAKRQNQLGPEIDVPPQYGHCSEGMIERYANKTHVTYHRIASHAGSARASWRRSM